MWATRNLMKLKKHLWTDRKPLAQVQNIKFLEKRGNIKNSQNLYICEVRGALESITMNKDSGGNGMPLMLIQILKYDAVRMLHSVCENIWKTQQ